MIVNASGLITDVLATLDPRTCSEISTQAACQTSNCPDQDDRQCIWINNGCTCNTDPRTCSEKLCSDISLPRPMIVNASGLITDVLATLLREPVQLLQLVRHLIAQMDDRQCIWINNGCTCNTDPRTCSEISTRACLSDI